MGTAPELVKGGGGSADLKGPVGIAKRGSEDNKRQSQPFPRSFVEGISHCDGTKKGSLIVALAVHAIFEGKEKRRRGSLSMYTDATCVVVRNLSELSSGRIFGGRGLPVRRKASVALRLSTSTRQVNVHTDEGKSAKVHHCCRLMPEILRVPAKDYEYLMKVLLL